MTEEELEDLIDQEICCDDCEYWNGHRCVRGTCYDGTSPESKRD